MNMILKQIDCEFHFRYILAHQELHGRESNVVSHPATNDDLLVKFFRA